MKILVCTNGYNSIKKRQIAIFQLDQARALRKYGHDVRIVSIDLRSVRHIRDFRTLSFEEKGIGAATSNFPFGRLPFYKIKYLISKHCARKVYEEITKDGWKPDILHAHFGDIAAAYVDISKEKNIPLIVTEHFSKMNDDILEDEVAFISDIAYKNATEIISVSDALRISIKEKLGYDSFVIPNIVDTEIFNVKKCGKYSNKFVFVSAGNLIKRKGMDILLNAFQKLKNPNAKLIIMGDGPERNKLIKQSKELGISDRVDFKGKYSRTEFSEVLSEAECFVLATRKETFGVVYIEALATGKPVIGTICGGPEEIITEENGILIHTDSVDELCCAMEKMMNSIDRYSSIEISNNVKRLYSGHEIAKRITEVYEGVLERYEQID